MMANIRYEMNETNKITFNVDHCDSVCNCTDTV